jgi:hypothetical protein
MSALDDAQRLRTARMALSMALDAMNNTPRGCPRPILERCYALREDVAELVEQADARVRKEMRAALAPRTKRRKGARHG